ncbi:MAG: hypothetical protein A3F92_02645 [Candidatus Rokubacteria bacterium RIFCSPLOWO2_12_FULL_71_22]|nr:MAG: hypothetical protein A3F92_02645 [Candidatus Rokubacteria bacterium RIFCSPLOWO2_12_FULL_71_22]
MTGARYRWAVLGVCVVAFMQTHLHRMAFAPLIPTFVGDLDLSYAAAGTIQTAYFWTYMAAQIPIGIVADRWGSRRVMLACMVLLALGAVAFAASGTFLASIGARMLVGLGAAAVWVPSMRLVTEWFPAAERGRATGLLSAGGGVGGTLALVLIPWAAALLGWRRAYLATLAPALAALALIVLLLPDDRRGAGPIASPRGSLRRVLATRALWPLNLSVLFAYGGYFSFVTFLPAFLVRGLGLTEAEAGATTSLITAGTIVSWPLAGLVSDRLGRRKPVYLFGQAASAAVCFVFALAVPGLGAAGAVAAAVATGLLVGGMIIPFAMIIEMFPAGLAGTAAGVTNASCFVGGMIFPIVLGWIADTTGGFTASFLAAGALQAVALGFACLTLETGSRARPSA